MYLLDPRIWIATLGVVLLGTAVGGRSAFGIRTVAPAQLRARRRVPAATATRKATRNDDDHGKDGPPPTGHRHVGSCNGW